MYDIRQPAITKKMADVAFFQNALRSEIVLQGELTTFEEQREHNKLFS